MKEDIVRDDAGMSKKERIISNLPVVELVRKMYNFEKASTKRYPKMAKIIAELPLEEAIDVIGGNGVALKLLLYVPSRWTSLLTCCTRLRKAFRTSIGRRV